MILHRIALQNFRNYKSAAFTFTQKTIIVGENAAGKSNLIEAIALLAKGKSFRTEKDVHVIHFGEILGRVKGLLQDETILEVAVVQQPRLQKKFLLNGVAKRRVDFIAKLPVVLFTPVDMELVSGSPGVRRRFLDDVLEQADSTYHTSLLTYAKALRQRNALLEDVRERGIRDEQHFAYWDELLITHGTVITQKRKSLIEAINARKNDLFPFILTYDASIMSKERLEQYKHAEVGAGVTLVGPHRDDVFIHAKHPVSGEMEEVKYFCSRGQQRLITLELKLAQIAYLYEQTRMHPLLLLDDIFSELDTGHIQQVLALTYQNQTIITTTHKEFIAALPLSEGSVIELGKD